MHTFAQAIELLTWFTALLIASMCMNPALRRAGKRLRSAYQGSALKERVKRGLMVVAILVAANVLLTLLTVPWGVIYGR